MVWAHIHTHTETRALIPQQNCSEINIRIVDITSIPVSMFSNFSLFSYVFVFLVVIHSLNVKFKSFWSFMVRRGICCVAVVVFVVVLFMKLFNTWLLYSIRHFVNAMAISFGL